MSVLSSIIRDTPPPVSDLNAQLPKHLGRIIRKALEKPVSRRYQIAIELKNDLDELKHEIDSGEILVSGTAVSDPEMVHVPAVPQKKTWRRLAVGLAFVLLVISGIWWAFVRGGNADAPRTSTVARVTTTGQAAYPTLSPDGEWIAFTRITPGTQSIFLQSLGDQTALQLTRDDLGPVGFPAFSPDGTQIAFNQLPGGGIYVMGRTGGNVRRLTNRGFNPSWSPDGKKITFALEISRGNPHWRGPDRELITVDVATGEERGTGIRDGVQPAWSPNGHRIAYWGRDKQAWRDIYTTAVGSTERVPVTQDVHVDHSPAWSADGQWLYFASTRGGPMAIWRVRIDERTGKTLGEPQALTAGGLTDPAFFSLSRDGRRLVYQEDPEPHRCVWLRSRHAADGFVANRGGGRLAVPDGSGCLARRRVAGLPDRRHRAGHLRRTHQRHRLATDHQRRLQGLAAEMVAGLAPPGVLLQRLRPLSDLGHQSGCQWADAAH
jgi:hypothetical protein